MIFYSYIEVKGEISFLSPHFWNLVYQLMLYYNVCTVIILDHLFPYFNTLMIDVI